MTLDEVIEELAALDGVRRREVRGLSRWECSGRLVARQLDAGSLVIRTELDAREQLVAADPETFTVPPRYETHMMVVVELAHADPGAVRRALAAARDLQSD